MYHVYSTMEEELDKCVAEYRKESSSLSASAKVWMEHESILRRANRLSADLADVSPATTQLQQSNMTPAVANYVASIRASGEKDRADNGGRLLGHLYCRYFADLFGGSVLKTPYNIALGLKEDTPRHYDFVFPSNAPKRRQFIERVYESLNEAGEDLSTEARSSIVQESSNAFAHNVSVYAEEPLLTDSILATSRLAIGAVMAIPRWVGDMNTTSRHA